MHPTQYLLRVYMYIHTPEYTVVVYFIRTQFVRNARDTYVDVLTSKLEVWMVII